MFVNQSEVIKHIENKFGNRLSYVSSPYQNINLPYFKDMDTGIEFVYIPGGEYNMGFSEEEYLQIHRLSETPNISIEEMRPVRKVRLSPFLLSITPVLNSHILNYNNHFGKSVEIDGEAYNPFFYLLAELI
jgi:hypothetical protein